MPKLKPVDPLAAVRLDPKGVKAFELNPAHARNHGLAVEPLAAFPEELFACTNLESLHIFRGIRGPGVTIPDGIGGLTGLRELTLGGLSIEALPESIGELKNLKTLSLAYCEQLASLPGSIGKLAALEELTLSYTTKLTALPKSIGELESLESLRLHAITEVPKELCQLTGLERLDLGGATKLPPGLGRLSNLQALTIHAEALASAGAEIAKLPKLRSIFVRGGAEAPPKEVFEIPTLRSLDIRAVGLTRLPPLDRLVELEELDVTGNALTELAAAIAVLPKLQKLSFSGNPLRLAEKRLVDAMMKVNPKDRAAMAARAPVKAKAKGDGKAKGEPKAKASAKATGEEEAKDGAGAPMRLGDVVGQNASLGILVAEGRVAAKYKGTDGDDWERATAALDEAAVAPFAIGKSGKGLVFSLDVGQGMASAWMLDEGTLVVVEAIFEQDEDALGDDDRALFYEFVGAPPAKGLEVSGTIALTRGQDWSLVLSPTTDSCSDVAKLLETYASTRARPCGSEGSGLLVDVVASKWALFLEPPVEAAWGKGRRALLVPR